MVSPLAVRVIAVVAVPAAKFTAPAPFCVIAGFDPWKLIVPPAVSVVIVTAAVVVTPVVAGTRSCRTQLIDAVIRGAVDGHRVFAGLESVPGGDSGGVPLKINVSVPLKDGTTPPSQLLGVLTWLPSQLNLFHVND